MESEGSLLQSQVVLFEDNGKGKVIPLQAWTDP
jgi:hypothetical protein